ncbi:MAG: DUF3772 domain-containing protein [Beijerinckiaceae bacterium]|nr:DUF3772 domain-containing protein [Beijerinckiaceae bacterium]
MTNASKSAFSGVIAFLFGLILVLTQAGALQAQAPATDKSRLDSINLQLQQLEATLQRRDLSDAQLTGVRSNVEPLLDELREMIAAQTPRLEGVKSRLEQLGPAPDAKTGATQSPEVAAEREAQEKLQKELDDTVRIAKFQHEKATQILNTVLERRRSLFASTLLERTTPLISPAIWFDVARNGPGELQHFLTLMHDWWQTVIEALDLVRALIVAVVFFLLAVVAPRLLRLVYRFEGRPSEVKEPSKLARAMRALRVSFGASLVPALICAALYFVFDALDLMPGRVAPIMRTLLSGIAFVFFVRAISMGVVPISKPSWRVFNVDDDLATQLQLLASAVATVLIAGKTLEAVSQAIVSPLNVSILIKGVTAVLIALVIMRVLRSLKVADDKQLKAEEECFGPQTSTPAERGNWLRIVGWLVTAAIVAAAVSGYVALASFLSQQIVWVAIVAVLVSLFLIIVDEAIGKGISSEGRLGREIRQAIGLRSGSVDQIGILTSGVLRLALIAIAAFMVLAPWGIDSADLTGYLKAAFFGFSIAGVTISLSAIAGAMLIFGIGLFLTRAIQRWLELRYLPHTGLDVGLRNSIKTIFGYIGTLLATALALGQAGLSLDKITIVAGALSVGIGFGLQSIVNNFVSGLILLWERPLRVGDWIVVGGEEGTVRRINVRATEIETFDKASVIVPNSEFISGRVKNWMHNNRQARIVIPISVNRKEEPKHIEELLLATAHEHRSVLSQPPARVFFLKITEASLDFELRCFTDVDATATTRSELMFTLYEKLRQHGVEMPMTAPTIALGDIDKLSDTLAARIAPGDDGEPAGEPARKTKALSR